MKKDLWLATKIGFVFIIGLIVASSLFGGRSEGNTMTKKKTEFGDGFHVAGKDFEPGGYSVTTDGYCAYTIYKSSSASSKDIEDTEIILEGKKSLVKILRDGQSIQTQGCGTWKD